jgi:hypothetical protein
VATGVQHRVKVQGASATLAALAPFFHGVCAISTVSAVVKNSDVLVGKWRLEYSTEQKYKVREGTLGRLLPVDVWLVLCVLLVRACAPSTTCPNLPHVFS